MKNLLKFILGLSVLVALITGGLAVFFAWVRMVWSLSAVLLEAIIR